VTPTASLYFCSISRRSIAIMSGYPSHVGHNLWA
jgi:hypothetical protein